MTENKTAESEQMIQSAEKTVKYFRSGYDAAGIDYLTSTLKQVEKKLDYLAVNPRNISKEYLVEIKAFLQTFIKLAKNNDLTGIIDLFDYQLIPLLQRWQLGDDESC